MRKIECLVAVLIIALVLPIHSAANRDSGSKIKWSTYKQAQKASKGDRKYFIYFYTDQCGYCRMLEAKTFSNDTVADYINNHYTPVRVNAGEEFKIASQYGIQGVPDLRFLSPSGENIARWPGFIESARLLALLQYIQTDSYKQMNFNDFIKTQPHKGK